MESRLKWPDYLIFIGFLFISLAIGIYHSLTGGRQKTVAEFIMGNRRLAVIPTAISFFVSFQSAIMLMGHTAELYIYGIQFIIFSMLVHVMVHIIVERIFVPWLYPLKLVSIYDYLEKRYMSKILRMTGAAIGVLVGILYTGVAIYAPSAALESVTGLPLAASVPIMTVLSVTYTVLGGIRAVIWTDVFQFLIMIGGIVTIFVKGLIVVGGISNVFRLAEEEGRLIWANVSLDPWERHTVWSIILGAGVNLVSSYGLSQMAVQRYCAVDKLSKARLMVLLNIPPTIMTFFITGIIGLTILAYYSIIQCDPLANKDIPSPNMLLPYFVVNIFSDSPGFSGLFLSTLYGASLSTVSSVLSGAAANCWDDLLKWKLNHLPETKKVLINRLLVVIFGAIATGVAFLAASIDRPILQVIIAFNSSLVGPMAAIFILGAISRHANWKGALLGGIVGVSVTMWLIMGSLTMRRMHPTLPPVSIEKCSSLNNNSTLFDFSLNYTFHKPSFGVLDETRDNWNDTTEVPSHANELQGLENIYALSYMLFPPIAVALTAVVGIVASLIMRDRDLEAKVDERLLLRLRICRWSVKNEYQEDLDDENKASPKETNARGLVESDDDIFNGSKLTASKEIEKRFLNDTKDNRDKKMKTVCSPQTT